MVPGNVYRVDAVTIVSDTCSRLALTSRTRALEHRDVGNSTSVAQGFTIMLGTSPVVDFHEDGRRVM